MGYYADGSGCIDIVANEDNWAEIAVDVKLMLDDAGFRVFIPRLFPSSIDYDYFGNYHEDDVEGVSSNIYFDYSGNYHEDDVIGVLNDISNKYESACFSPRPC